MMSFGFVPLILVQIKTGDDGLSAGVSNDEAPGLAL